MKLKKRIITLGLVAILTMLPISNVMAMGTTPLNPKAIYTEAPTLEINENNGTCSVTATDANGNIVFEKTENADSIEDIIYSTYDTILAESAKSCTHIPCRHNKVWGGINHIISGSTCTMVRYKFYQCACCKAIIGLVPNSGTIVGTHPAH